MNILVLISFVVLACGCQALPELFKTADDALTDTAIKIEISREAIHPGSVINTDVTITPQNNR